MVIVTLFVLGKAMKSNSSRMPDKFKFNLPNASDIRLTMKSWKLGCTKRNIKQQFRDLKRKMV